MQVDPEDIRRSFAYLADEELMAMDRATLTEMARKIYDEEVAARGLSLEDEAPAIPDEAPQKRPRPARPAPAGEDFAPGPEPDWIDDAALASSFDGNPDDALAARDALVSAGIPCYIQVTENDARAAVRVTYGVLVHSAHVLHASSILDRDLFNPQQEDEWRAHLELLSDDDLCHLNPEIFCAGLADRVARLRRAYNDEVARRFRRQSVPE